MTVAIVIVSHSARLAEGVKELAGQMAATGAAQGRVQLLAAGGLDAGTPGTNVATILEALIAADNPDGTLVLMDLGSALLSAETALELLPEAMRPRVRLCAAPLVEGAVVAAVQASLGSDLETVYREALHALEPKAGQLGENLPEQAAQEAGRAAAPLAAQVAPTAAVPPAVQTLILTLSNPHGLHARPAARLVQTAAGFEAEVSVADLTNGKGPVTARSLNRLATLGALQGHRLRVEASGRQAAEALTAVRDLVERGFGEVEAGAMGGVMRQAEGMRVATAGLQKQPEESEPGLLTVTPGMIQAVPVVDGLALAPLAHLDASPYSPPFSFREGGAGPAASPPLEWSSLHHALDSASRQMQSRRERVAAQMGAAEAGIFDAHQLILQDPELLATVRTRIFEQGMTAARAWDRSIRDVAESYTALEDPYLQRRAQDVVDVGHQVLLALAGQMEGEITFERPVILVAHDLSPDQVARLDLTKVVGLATLQGGPTSHSAILARAAGIPAVSGIPQALLDLEPGTLLALDGATGRLWIAPGENVRLEIASRREAWLAEKRRLRQAGRPRAATRDGTPITVAANVGGLVEAEAAVQNGADGIGLLRSEFLFLRRSTPPDEQTQVEALRAIFARLPGRPVIVRTLDVGGDKRLPYIDLPAEANPYLGVRAIRLSQRRPDLLLVQLRAILRAGAPGQAAPGLAAPGLAAPELAAPGLAAIMFPMIAALDELQFGRALLEQAHRELAEEGVEHAWPVEMGIMVETPAAALLAEALAPQVDFFSIGTNDLTQYTLAAERGNPALAGYADALHPAVLQLIRRVVEAALLHGKWVGVCGELAGDPAAAPVLVGLGVRELSMSPGSIPRIKEVIGRISVVEAKALALQALAVESAAVARALAEQFLG